MRFKVNGKKIRDLRESKNVSQRRMATLMEIPYMTLRRIEEVDENNLSKFSVDKETIHKIADYFDTTYLELLPKEIKLHDVKKDNKLDISKERFVEVIFYKISSAQQILELCVKVDELSLINLYEEISPDIQELFLKILKKLEDEKDLHRKLGANDIEKSSDRFKKIFDLSNDIKLLEEAGYNFGYSLIGKVAGFDVGEYDDFYWEFPGRAMSFAIKKFLLLSLRKKDEVNDLTVLPDSENEVVLFTSEISIYNHHVNITDRELVEKIQQEYSKYIVQDKIKNESD